MPRTAQIKTGPRGGNSVTVRELKLWRKMRVSQLEKLVDAMGGRLTVDAVFSDRTIRLAPAQSPPNRDPSPRFFYEVKPEPKPVPEKPQGALSNSEILEMWREQSR